MLTQDNDSLTGELALRRGALAARAGLQSVAAAYFQRAAESSPDDTNVWLWLAWVANSPDNAIRCLEQVLALSPGHAAATAGLMWARALANDTPVAPAQVAITTSECTIPVIAETHEEAAPIVAELVNTTPEPEQATTPAITPEASAESSWEMPAEQPHDPWEADSAPATVEVVAEAARGTIQELSGESPQLGPARRRWSDLVQRGAETQSNEVMWSSLVPPPLPIESASVKTEPEFVVQSRFNEVPAVAVTKDVRHDPETGADVEALARSFNPPAEVLSSDGRPLVMVVDDSPTVRKLVSLTLERRGYRVISAFDGVAAIKELGSCRPDLILLDINMPRLDGYRLCKLIKKHEATQSIPVVMLSGKDGMFDKLRGRLVGCSDYITKPFEADALTHKVAKYLTPASSSL